MASRNADSAAQAKELMSRVDENFVPVDVAHGQLVGAMKEIGSSSGKISKIIKVIDDIAFQTNILALNADEVRNVAQRSAQAETRTPPR